MAPTPPPPNDTARFLAGMPPAADSPLAPLTKDKAWQEHAKAFDSSFERAEHNIGRVRAWSHANLTTARPTLFYMFSGPDFIYANAFYPKAKTYVLSGLEQVGAVPDLTTLRGSLAPDLSALRNSLRWLLQHSYFITSQMGSDLHRGRMNGTLPVLYVFLARSGHTIREVTPVRLDENGAVQPDSESGRRIPARGVKIVFAGSDGEARTLYYFSTDLSNGGVANSKFLDFCQTLGARGQPGEERLLPAAQPGLLEGPRVPAGQQRGDSPGRYRRPPHLLRPAEVGPAAIRPICRPDPHLPRHVPKEICHAFREAAVRSISASATDGGPTSRTCCWPSRSREFRRRKRGLAQRLRNRPPERR